MSSFTFNDPILSTRRKGDILDPYIPVVQSILVERNKAILAENPDSFNRVIVSGQNITWVEIDKDLPTENQFIVDYSLGIVTFHPSRNNLELQFNYYGTGCDYFPASRVWTINEGYTVVETLGNLVDDGRQAIISLGGLATAIQTAITLENSLISDISTGNTLNTTLILTNTTASNTNSTLTSTNTTGNTLNTTLILTNTTASNTNNALIASNNNATNTKTALDLSNTNATNTNDILTATNITANNTNTTLNVSISAGTATKNDLDSSISTATTKNTTLISTISDALAVESNLQTIVQNIETSDPFYQKFIATLNQQDFVLTGGTYKEYTTIFITVQGVSINQIEDFILVADGNNNKFHINEPLPLGTEVSVTVLGTLPIADSFIIP